MFPNECGSEEIEKTLMTEDEGLFVRSSGEEISASKPSQFAVRMYELQFDVGVRKRDLLSTESPRRRPLSRNQRNA